jgi:hypothetical protein
MTNTPKVIQKSWDDLTPDEIMQIDQNQNREWHIAPMTKASQIDTRFFLLEDTEQQILAEGFLEPVAGIRFNDEIFNIFGIGSIIANVKGQRYGSAIMKSIKDYLLTHHASCVGFTDISGFYEKCGFFVSKEAIHRFIYLDGEKKIVNTESDRICYLDGSDQFMQKVLTHPDQDVYLPRKPDW